jgi:uncharacterized coiled-coil protein SlyX
LKSYEVSLTQREHELHKAEELLKLMYRKNEAHRAAGRVLHESLVLKNSVIAELEDRIVNQQKDMNGLRVHIDKLVRHITILVAENKDLRGDHE